MGNKASTQPVTNKNEKDVEAELAKFLKGNSPLQWSPQDVVQWLKLNKIADESLFGSILDDKIDGEFISEAPSEILQNYLKEHSKENIETFIDNQIRNHDMVLAFQMEEKTEIQLEDHKPNIEELTIENAKDLIIQFHKYTYNSLESGAPTVKRMWAHQPKISRRYYGAKVVNLTPREKKSSIDRILYYSLAVSAYQTADQRLMWPRCVSSKRVNPSR